MKEGKLNTSENSRDQSSPSVAGGRVRVYDMHYGASKLIFQRAEELRKFPTHEEEIIWGYLSGNKSGVKFRRQHPVANYIADFYCHSLKLVIEIDGSIHNKSEVKINDEDRQHHVESFGIKVIRFTNNEVRRSPEKVMEKIYKEIKKLQSNQNQTSPSGAGNIAPNP